MPATASPLVVPAGASSYPVTLTGSGTAWTASQPFTVSGIAGASIESQTVASATSTVLYVTLGGTAGTLTIDDGAGTTTTVTVIAWQTLKDDSFARADVAAGGAGSQVFGQNWIDVAGNAWSIAGGTAKAIGPGGTTVGNMLLRPTSESAAPQRIVMDRVFDTSNQTFRLIARYQADTSHYALICSAGTTLRLSRYSAAGSESSLVNFIVPQPATGDNATFSFSVVTVGGNPYLVGRYVNNTTGYEQVIAVSDTNAAKITAAGRCGASYISATPVGTVARLRTYYQNQASAQATPNGGLSNRSDSLALLGTGTAWTSGTSFTLATSGANGAALGTPTIVDATHATVPMTSTGSANDSLVITDGTSGTQVAYAVTASTISASPAQLSAGTTGNVVRLRGNNQKWTSQAPSFSSSGVAGVSIANVAVVSDTVADLTINVGSATGTLTITEATFPASITVPVNFVLPLSDANVVLSPYTWRLNGSRWAEANFPGYARLRFTTTTAAALKVLYDPTPNIDGGLAASNYPTLGYVLNPNASGSTRTLAKLNTSGSLTITASLPAGTHDLLIDLAAIGGGPADTGRWNPSARKLRLLGIQVDPSAVTVAIPKRAKTALVIGDSITQSVGVTAKTPAGDDAMKGWPRTVADGLGAEWGNLGWAGQAWSDNSQLPASVPLYSLSRTPPDTYSYHEAGVSRLVSGSFSPVPDYVFINMGTNDTGRNIVENVKRTLADLRAKCGPNAWIFPIIPFNQAESSTSTGIPAGVAAYLADTPDAKVKLIDCGNDIAPVAGLNNTTAYNPNAWTYDGLHPKQEVAQAFGGRIAALALAAMVPAGSSGPPLYRNVDGTAQLLTIATA